MKQRAGFTLVELMVVVMVMALLGMIVLGISGYASRKAAESRAKADLENLRTALEEHRLEHGRYPPSTPNFVLADDDGSPRPLYWGLTNYVEDIRFLDPWGRSYRYHLQSRFMFRVWSLGPTGELEDYDIIE